MSMGDDNVEVREGTCHFSKFFENAVVIGEEGVEDNNGDNVGILSISMFGGSLLDLVAAAQLALLAPMIFQDPW
jgi:hypothetical protein